MSCKNVNGSGGDPNWSALMRSDKVEFTPGVVSGAGDLKIGETRRSVFQVGATEGPVSFFAASLSSRMEGFTRCLRETPYDLQVRVTEGHCCDKVEVTCFQEIMKGGFLGWRTGIFKTHKTSEK